MFELDQNSIVPLYKQLKDRIKEAILSGELKPNQKIPSELELSQTYQISRITVRNAISENTLIQGSLRAFQDAVFEALRDGLYEIAREPLCVPPGSTRAAPTLPSCAAPTEKSPAAASSKCACRKLRSGMCVN